MMCVHVLLATPVLIVVSVLQDTSEQLMELVNVWKANKIERFLKNNGYFIPPKMCISL